MADDQGGTQGTEAEAPDLSKLSGLLDKVTLVPRRFGKNQLDAVTSKPTAPDGTDDLDKVLAEEAALNATRSNAMSAANLAVGTGQDASAEAGSLATRQLTMAWEVYHASGRNLKARTDASVEAARKKYEDATQELPDNAPPADKKALYWTLRKELATAFQVQSKDESTARATLGVAVGAYVQSVLKAFDTDDAAFAQQALDEATAEEAYWTGVADLVRPAC